jgi:hypothetical protein
MPLSGVQPNLNNNLSLSSKTQTQHPIRQAGPFNLPDNAAAQRLSIPYRKLVLPCIG